MPRRVLFLGLIGTAMDLTKAARPVDTAFSRFGRAATYTPPSGVEVAGIRVIVMQDDDEGIDWGQARPQVRTSRLEVRRSEIAEPVKGGLFALSGESYRIVSKPRLFDSARLVWACQCEAVS